MTPARTSARRVAGAAPPGSDPGRRDELDDELAALRRTEAELRELLADAHQQLAQRDEELVRSALAHRRVEEMRETRVWRTATRYWATRDRLRAWLRRLRSGRSA